MAKLFELVSKVTGNQSGDAPGKALRTLKRVRELEGAALISSGVMLHQDFPRGIDSKSFAGSILKLFEGLEQKNEYANDVFLRFDGGHLLLQFRYPVILCQFPKIGSDLGLIERGGDQFLNQFSAVLGIQSQRPKRNAFRSRWSNASPAPEKQNLALPAIPATSAAPVKESGLVVYSEYHDSVAWQTYRRQIELLFSKVLGSAQAGRVVSRELEAMGVAPTGFLRRNQFLPFGQRMASRIKDKKIRREIESELDSLLDKGM